MIEKVEDLPRLGEGIYTLSEAVRILTRPGRAVSERQIRHWVRTSIVPPTFVHEDHPLLSFHDLVSLEVVARFVAAGWSVQGVRRIEEELREEFGRARPFAYRQFFTDGSSVWARAEHEDQLMTELIGRHRDRRHKSITWAGAVETFAEEIRFEGLDQVAAAWDLAPFVEIDPEVQFGAPVVTGTRVPISTVIANLEVGSPAEVARWYDLSVEEVVGVRDYLAYR